MLVVVLSRFLLNWFFYALWFQILSFPLPKVVRGSKKRRRYGLDAPTMSFTLRSTLSLTGREEVCHLVDRMNVLAASVRKVAEATQGLSAPCRPFV